MLQHKNGGGCFEEVIMQISKKIKKKNNIKSYDGWSFATINGRLGEIHFIKNFGIWAHCYVKRSEFSKSEQKMIDVDIKKCQFSYRKGYYYDKIRKIKYKVPSFNKIFPDLKNEKRKALTALKLYK